MAKSTAGRIVNVLWNVLFNPLATWISFFIIRKQHYYNDPSMGEIRQFNGMVMVSSFLGAMLGVALFFLLSPLFNPLGLLAVPVLVGIGYAMVWSGSIIFKAVAIEVVQYLRFENTPDKAESAEVNAELISQNLLTSLGRAVLGNSRQDFLTLMDGNTKVLENMELNSTLPPVAPPIMAPAHAQLVVSAPVLAVVPPPARLSHTHLASASSAGHQNFAPAHEPSPAGLLAGSMRWGVFASTPSAVPRDAATAAPPSEAHSLQASSM